jgi:hypothetical protein
VRPHSMSSSFFILCVVDAPPSILM